MHGDDLTAQLFSTIDGARGDAIWRQDHERADIGYRDNTSGVDILHMGEGPGSDAEQGSI